MSITLEFSPETERRVVSAAEARGLSIEAYLMAVIEGETGYPTMPSASVEEFEADMDLLAEDSDQIPVLPPEAYSRESMYSTEG